MDLPRDVWPIVFRYIHDSYFRGVCEELLRKTYMVSRYLSIGNSMFGNGDSIFGIGICFHRCQMCLEWSLVYAKTYDGYSCHCKK